MGGRGQWPALGLVAGMMLGGWIAGSGAALAYPPPSLLAEMQPPTAEDYYRLWEVRTFKQPYRPMGPHAAKKPVPCPPPPMAPPLMVDGTIEWGAGFPPDCPSCGKYPHHGQVGPYGTMMPAPYYLEEPHIIMPVPAFGKRPF